MESVIESFFAALPGQKRARALRLRDIIIEVHPKIVERINGVTLHLYTSVYSFETISYINLAFFKGTLLPDPKRILEGTGKGMRHIKTQSEKDINKKQIISWIKEAIKLNAKDKGWLEIN